MLRNIIFLLIFFTRLKNYSADPIPYDDEYSDCASGEYDEYYNCVEEEGGDGEEGPGGDVCVLSGELGGDGKSRVKFSTPLRKLDVIFLRADQNFSTFDSFSCWNL